MEEFEMTQTELILFLETLAENVELKAKTGEDAAGIIRKKIEVRGFPIRNKGKAVPATAKPYPFIIAGRWKKSRAECRRT